MSSLLIPKFYFLVDGPMPFQVFSRFLGVLGVSWDPTGRAEVWWVVSVEFFDGEFDPGSGRTLAACLT
ncbi:hypothetical protein ACF045_10550, partial [Kocuria rhizophila]|uniref:hypothetical protein n=1 Tax=Kocuria rhizophila TaxID=72000 RepID=UPI0036B03D08